MSDQEKAVELIRDELARSHDNPALNILGEWLTEQAQTRPEIAAAILKAKDPVEAGYKAIRDQARKMAKGGVACVDEKTAYGIMEKALGFEAAPTKEAPKTQALAPAQDALDLDALLG